MLGSRDGGPSILASCQVLMCGGGGAMCQLLCNGTAPFDMNYGKADWDGRCSLVDQVYV